MLMKCSGFAKYPGGLIVSGEMEAPRTETASEAELTQDNEDEVAVFRVRIVISVDKS